VSVAIPSRAARLIERLVRVADHYADPTTDSAAVEDALGTHMRRLGISGLSVRFVETLASGRALAGQAALKHDAWIGTWRMQWRDACRSAWQARTPWSTARRLAHVSARRTVALESWQRLQHLPPIERESRGLVQVTLDWCAEQALCDAVEVAVDLVTWTAEPDPAPAIERWITLISPLVDAFEAGLWLCWLTPGQVLVLLRPAVKLEQGRLHCEDGPAIAWPGGARLFFWRGIQVPAKLVLSPLDIMAQEILAETDVEVRRLMLERYGPGRFIQDVGASLVDADETGELYRHELADDEPLCMIRVLDATTRPDGTRRSYWLRVPPTIHTAREAVAWTFGMEAARYRPDRET
jgi:hypothetical protein